MKKALVLSMALAMPLALSLAMLVPNIVFLVASLFFPLPGFLFENLLIGGGALLATLLFGIGFGGSATNTLLESFLVGL